MASQFQDSQREPTVRLGEVAVRPQTTLCAVVMHDSRVDTYPLSNGSRVTVGRGEDADIIIDHASISRRHALLNIGENLTVEDLGSSNGTWVRDVPLEPSKPIEVFPDDVIDLGSAMIVVQYSSSPERPRRLCTHAYFEMRVEEECARAEHSKHDFAIVRFRLPSPLASGAMRSIITSKLRPDELVAVYAPGDYEILLFDIGDKRVEKLSKDLTTAFADRGVACSIGVAIYPQHGTAPDALLARAGNEAHGVHDEVEPGNKELIVRDGGMQRLHRLVGRVADSSLSVFLLGETGVGKEVVAEQVHRRSPRASGPLLRLNCAALAESLLEAELFGYERGAFTGAVKAKPGLLENCNGGTVFLDEVTEMPLSTQVKLLRVVEERRVMRVGGLTSKPIDVRFVAATNRNVEDCVQQGVFRHDLYFRLNGFTLVIPPLRDRLDELMPLADMFLRRQCQGLGRKVIPRFLPETVEIMNAYEWPGNIRELRNVVERALILCTGNEILLGYLPLERMNTRVLSSTLPTRDLDRDSLSRVEKARSRVEEARPAKRRRRSSANLNNELENVERERINQALDECAGNQTRAAALLGISRSTLVRRLAQYGIARPNKGTRFAG